MLRIPTASDTPPPLTAQLRRVTDSGPAADPVAEPAVMKKRRRSRKGSGGESHSWEQQSRSSRSRGGEKRQMALMAAGGAALFAVILGGVFYSMSKGNTKQPITTTSIAPPPVAEPSVDPEAPTQSSEPVVVQRSEAELMAEAESLARKFLQAKTVEEMLPLVNEPDIAEKRMRPFYEADGITAPGLSAFNSTGGFAVKGKLVSADLVTGDFDQRPMAFVDTPAGLRIDWESWAGWSEMTWGEFRSKKPTEPHVFRLSLSPVVYYNFGFDDESKWKSFRLESPDQEHSIYGYVEKDSMLEEQIRLDRDTKKVFLMLSLKFPPDAEKDNQVIIERFVNEGWVEEKNP